jgi:hypothetical protein
VRRAKPVAVRLNTSALTGPDSTAQSLADLDQEGNVLTVVSGTTMHSFARNKVKNAKISALSGSSSAVLDVMQKASRRIYRRLLDELHLSWRTSV